MSKGIQALVVAALCVLAAQPTSVHAELISVKTSGVARATLSPYFSSGDSYSFEFTIDTNAIANSGPGTFRGIDVSSDFVASFAVEGTAVLQNVPVLLCVAADETNLASVWGQAIDRLACFVSLDTNDGILFELLIPELVSNPVSDPPLASVTPGGIAELTFGVVDSNGVPLAEADRNTSVAATPIARGIFVPGHLFVADRPIKVYRPDGGLVRTLGDAALGQPGDVEFNHRRDVLYVSDRQGGEIFVFDQSGSRTQIIGPAPGETTAWGISVDANGNAYVIGDGGRINLFANDGTYLRTISTPSSFVCCGIHTALSGDKTTLFASENNFGTGVHAWDLRNNDSYLGFFGDSLTTLGLVRGIATAPDGTLYATNNDLQKLSASGNFQSTVATGLVSPIGVAVDDFSQVWVTDTNAFVAGQNKILGFDRNNSPVSGFAPYPELVQPVGMTFYRPPRTSIAPTAEAVGRDGQGTGQPFDGTFDQLVGPVAPAFNLGTEIRPDFELRSTIEFDVSSLSGGAVRFAALSLAKNGGTGNQQVFKVHGYLADGVPALADMHIGNKQLIAEVLTTDDVGTINADLRSIDVTSFVQSIAAAGGSFVGFTLQSENFGGRGASSLGIWGSQGAVSDTEFAPQLLVLLDAPPQFHLPVAEFPLTQNFSDSQGGPEIISNGGTLERRGYQFGPNEGLTLGGVIDPTNHSVEMVFSVDDPAGANGITAKLLDFANLTEDVGWYTGNDPASGDNGKLGFFRFNPTIGFVLGNEVVFNPDELVHFVTTRSGSTNEVVGYINGVEQVRFNDNAGDATFKGPTSIASFFIDDAAGVEASGGFVDYINIYDQPMSASQITAIATADADSDSVPDVLDNCVDQPNLDQEDMNLDGFGDECVDPNIVIPPGVDIGENPTIGPGTSIGGGASIGDNADVGADVTLAKDSELGDDVTVGDGSEIQKGASVGNGVTLGSNCFVAKGAIIEDGVTIGNDCDIKSGAVVGQNSRLGNSVRVGRNATVVADSNVPDGTNVRNNDSFP